MTSFTGRYQDILYTLLLRSDAPNSLLSLLLSVLCVNS